MRTSPLPPQAEDVARRLNNLAALFDGDGVDLASRVGRVIDIWQARKTGGDCVCARARARARVRVRAARLPPIFRACGSPCARCKRARASPLANSAPARTLLIGIAPRAVACSRQFRLFQGMQSRFLHAPDALPRADGSYVSKLAFEAASPAPATEEPTAAQENGTTDAASGEPHEGERKRRRFE